MPQTETQRTNAATRFMRLLHAAQDQHRKNQQPHGDGFFWRDGVVNGLESAKETLHAPKKTSLPAAAAFDALTRADENSKSLDLASLFMHFSGLACMALGVAGADISEVSPRTLLRGGFALAACSIGVAIEARKAKGKRDGLRLAFAIAETSKMQDGWIEQGHSVHIQRNGAEDDASNMTVRYVRNDPPPAPQKEHDTPPPLIGPWC